MVRSSVKAPKFDKKHMKKAKDISAKRCEYNNTNEGNSTKTVNKDEDNNSKTLNNKNMPSFYTSILYVYQGLHTYIKDSFNTLGLFSIMYS